MSEAKSLYHLVTASREVEVQLAENGGEVTFELETVIKDVQAKLPEKVDSYKYVIDGLYSAGEELRKKAQAFLEIAKSYESHADKMTEQIKSACIQLNVKEIEGNDYVWKLQKSKPSVIIDDEAKIPGGHIEVVVTQTKKIRKASILEDLKAGVSVPGAHMEEGFSVKAVPFARRISK